MVFRMVFMLVLWCITAADEVSMWAPVEEVCSLADTLDGELVLPGNPRYDDLRELRNLHYTNTPGMIILAHSSDDVDVIEALSLARKYNLQPTVSGSGHDFIGRSTANNSIHIDMSAMRGIVVNPEDPDSDTGASAVIESGTNWAQVHEEVDKYGLLALGGSAHSVSLGGYILGGGHSPMTRSLGLGVDSVLGITMVTASGNLLYVDNEGVRSMDLSSETIDNDTQLFWALLGGGGGTFGIALSFKVRLYQPPSSFFHLSLSFPIRSLACPDAGADIMRTIHGWYKNNLNDNRINAYIFSTNFRSNIPVMASNGNIAMSSLFFGPWEEAFPIYKPLINLHPECLPIISLNNFSTFWEYEKIMNYSTSTQMYIVNRFIQKDDLINEIFIKTMTSDIFDYDVLISCTACSIGGQAQYAPEGRTSVSPDFRFGTQSTTCATTWINENDTDHHIAEMRKWGEKFYQSGRGMYYNEPDYYVENWKLAYWGSMETYEGLLDVKEKWDPEHMFWCHNCVGSDLRDPPSQRVPSGDRVTHEMCFAK